ncbi:hypothetical protein [Rhizobium leguminosarum]|uniref:hypothetical protein n=1 Tax=Rhizobium leguminosarum TaxID=384 RepID=UPI003D6E380B
MDYLAKFNPVTVSAIGAAAAAFLIFGERSPGLDKATLSNFSAKPGIKKTKENNMGRHAINIDSERLQIIANTTHVRYKKMKYKKYLPGSDNGFKL